MALSSLKKFEIKSECDAFLKNRGSFKYSTERAAALMIQLVEEIEQARELLNKTVECVHKRTEHCHQCNNDEMIELIAEVRNF